MTTNEAWSSSQMWRVAGSLHALHRTIHEARAVLTASQSSRLEREYDRLEQKRKRLVCDTQRIAVEGTQHDRDALIQQILQFYREVGELEGLAGAESVGL